MPDQNYIVSRDYLGVKQWDMRMGKAVHSSEVSEAMSHSLASLHRNDALDDEFFLTMS
jgi:hypothetical protein